MIKNFWGRIKRIFKEDRSILDLGLQLSSDCHFLDPTLFSTSSMLIYAYHAYPALTMLSCLSPLLLPPIITMIYCLKKLPHLQVVIS